MTMYKIWKFVGSANKDLDKYVGQICRIYCTEDKRLEVTISNHKEWTFKSTSIVAEKKVGNTKIVTTESGNTYVFELLGRLPFPDEQ